MANYEALKEKIFKAVEENHAEMIACSDDLADHPELSAHEYRSSQKLVELLRGHGYEVEYPFAGIDTAFKAVYGSNDHKYKVAVLAEYDALPEIGHACGHCISGSISILAGLATKDIQDEMDCDVHVIGTPNEEEDGAKCTMVKQGVFKNYDMAIMVHLDDSNKPYCTLLALDSYMFNFHGKAAHGAAAPWEGINALNAAQLFVHAVDCMRQHVTPDVRMHGIYRNGGAAPNVVPDEASYELYTRAADRKYLNKLNERVKKMADGACLMTGCTWDMYPTAQSYDNLVLNDTGIAAIREVFDELGIEENADPNLLFGSSDIGNVSFQCPAFHPTIQLTERGVPIHTKGFEAAVRTERGHNDIALGAKLIALDIAKIFTDEERVAQMKADFKKMNS